MYKYVDHSKPPFIDISLPPAIIVPVIPLTILYIIELGIDFALLYNERHFKKYISPTQLRIGMAITHIIIPLVFTSYYPPLNMMFAAIPWFLATYSARIPTEELTLEKWVYSLFRVTIVDDEISKSKSKIRYKGISKVSLGLFKLAFVHIMIDPLLPRRLEYTLEYAWFSPISLMYTVLFGIKAYCLLGIVDVITGAEQALFAWNIIDLFDFPILSLSPRDFWSRRWNKVVRNLLHTQVFSIEKNDATSEELTKPVITEEKKPMKKKPTSKKVTTKKTTTTVTTTVTKRVTRSSAAAVAAAAASVIASPVSLNDGDDNILTEDESEFEQEEHDVKVTQNHRKTKSATFWTSRQGRGLLTFVVSGIFHELLIMSTCRKITLENFLFFTIQGIAVMIEVEIRQGALKQEPKGTTRVICIMLQLLFMAITDITLPQPFVVPALQLTGLYTCMLGIDYVLLRNQKKLVFISKNALRVGMTVAHAIVPLVVVSPLPTNNVTFAAVPWFLASYSAYLPTEKFSLKQWIQALYSTIVDRNADDSNVHRMGLVKALRGIAKLSVLYFGVEPMLPTMPDDMLTHPWFSQTSLLDTFLFGLKAYLILGAVDITTGLAQALTGWCMVDMFDSPLLATSPRDFWSNRWNKTVRNLLHSQVFVDSRSDDISLKKTDEIKINKKKGFFSTNQGRGLMTFIVSGAFHELIICSVCRKVTLENLCFFTLHGIACMLEVNYLNRKKKPKGLNRIGRIVAQLSFMTITGRLFLAPFLRYRFTQVLPLTKF